MEYKNPNITRQISAERDNVQSCLATQGTVINQCTDLTFYTNN